MLGRNGPGASEDAGPGLRQAGAAAVVTLRGYFSIMASCPGRPVVDVLGKECRATTRQGRRGRERRAGLSAPQVWVEAPLGGTGPKHMT